MFGVFRAMRRIRKRMGRNAYLMLSTRDVDLAIESEQFSMLCERADKRKLWATITGWDKVLDKPAVWKNGELI